MRAGESWWIGRAEAFEYAVDRLCPPQLSFDEIIRKATIRTGRYREGVAIKTDAMMEFAPITRQFTLWKVAKMLELASEESTQRAQAAVERLELHLANFRSKVNNDLASIKAASQRVQTEAQSMGDKYNAAKAMLTSPDFERAVANAERMAVALEAISKLSETKLSVAVFSGSNPPNSL